MKEKILYPIIVLCLVASATTYVETKVNTEKIKGIRTLLQIVHDDVKIIKGDKK